MLDMLISSFLVGFKMVPTRCAGVLFSTPAPEERNQSFVLSLRPSELNSRHVRCRAGSSGSFSWRSWGHKCHQRHSRYSHSLLRRHHHRYSSALPQMLLQKIDSQRPCFRRRFLIAHTMGWINESMTGIIYFDRDIFALRFEHLLDLLDLIRGDALILTSIDSQHRSIDLRHLFRCGVVASTIKSHHCSQVGIARCDDIGHKAAYAETHQAELFRLDVWHSFYRIECADNLSGCSIDIAAYHHHHSLRIVGFGRNLAVIKIGDRYHKAFGCQLLGKVADMWFDAPPFLDQYDAWMPGIVIGLCHKSIGPVAVHFQVNS